MPISYIKKLQNEIDLYETRSDRIISLEHYYVVAIAIDSSELTSNQKNKSPVELLKSIATELIGVYQYKPSLIYVSLSCIYFLYPPIETQGQLHAHEGSQQHIISEVSSLVSILSGASCTVRIVEFESKSQVVAYMCLKNFENVRESLIVHSNNKVTKKDVANYTLNECIEMFDTRTKTSYEKLSPILKYGVFMRGGKNVSIALDFRDTATIDSLLF